MPYLARSVPGNSDPRIPSYRKCLGPFDATSIGEEGARPGGSGVVLLDAHVEKLTGLKSGDGKAERLAEGVASPGRVHNCVTPNDFDAFEGGDRLDFHDEFVSLRTRRPRGAG